jgi:integrase
VSVSAVKRNGGNKRAFKVRYRDATGKARSETYSVKADADKRDAEIRLAKQRGEPLPKKGRGDPKQTFEAFAYEVWWPTAVQGARLSARAQERYASWLDNHLIPRIGDEPLAHIDVAAVLDVKAGLARDAVPDYTSARTLKLLRQILGFAVLSGKLAQNPADVLRARGMLPPQGRKGDVRPLWPDETELIRAGMLNGQSPHALRNATLISVLAYAGLRPSEALHELCWQGVGDDYLQVRAGKTGRSRTIPELIKPLLGDLAAWREASRSTAAKALVFPDDDGGAWGRTALGNWRNREFKPRAPEGARIYDLRHGYASLLIREGVDPAEVAARMGHSLTMTTAHYAHVFQQHRNKPREPMEKVVLDARKAVTAA